MRFLIFCLLVSFCLCLEISEARYFRFRNATLIRGDRNPITFFGTLHYQEPSPFTGVWFYGMDYSTKTHLFFLLKHRNELTTGSKVDVHCMAARNGTGNLESMYGKGHVRFYTDGCELSAECHTESGDFWVLTSLNVATEKLYYSPKEAGFRAKFLIDQPKSKYGPEDVITFATFDHPYLYKDCKDFLGSWYLDAPGPEPGAIMVGKNGEHCAILDDEGTKFTHTNPAAGKVTYDSIAVAQRYFPSGIVYKRWRDE